MMMSEEENHFETQPSVNSGHYNSIDGGSMDEVKEHEGIKTFDDYKCDDASSTSIKNLCGKCPDVFRQQCCGTQALHTYLPITKWLPKYRLQDLQGDVIAGLTVGLTVIPQGLAYGKIAGLPEQYGLYSAFMGCFVYCLLGTSKDITLGPTAIMSLLTNVFASSRAPALADKSDYSLTVAYCVVLTLMTGIVQLALGVCKLGILTTFISHPVISSFTSAAAITIAAGQVKHILGLSGVRRDFPHLVYDTFRKLPETNLYDLTLGLICITLLIVIKVLKDRKWGGTTPTRRHEVIAKVCWFVGIARNAIIVLTAALLCAGLRARGKNPFTSVSPIDGKLPHPRLPAFSFHEHAANVSASKIFSTISDGFIIVPLLGLVETIAIGTAFAKQNNYKIESSQELIAMGTSNILGSFFQAYPVTGSFSRTAVNSQSGVRTPAGGVVTGGLVLLALGVLTPYFQYIPEAALAAVIIMAVLQMTDFAIVLKLWHIKPLDLLPWTVTFILSFVIGIEYGIVAGVGVSLCVVLYPEARPAVEVEEGASCVVVTPRRGLSFPAIHHLSATVVNALQECEGKLVVLDLGRVTEADYSFVEGMQDLLKDCRRLGSPLILAALQEKLYGVVKRAEIEGLHLCSTLDSAQAFAAQFRASPMSAVAADLTTPLLRSPHASYSAT